MNKIKNILFTSFDGIPNDAQGGPNNIIYKILSNLDREKYSPSFLSYWNFIENCADIPSGRLKPGIRKKITDYLYYNTSLYGKITASQYYLERHFKLRDVFFEKHAGENNWDIIHSHDTLSHYYFVNRNNAFKILTIHGNGSIENDWADAVKKNVFVKDYMPELKRREIEAFNNADVVTFPGNYARDLFLSDYKGKIRVDKDIRVINNGIDKNEIDNIKPDNITAKKYRNGGKYDLVFLNVAAHVRQKNIELIISVISELVEKGKNPLLINAGYGPLTGEIKALIKKHNLNRNIKLAGKLEHKSVISLMKSSDALIMLSDRVIFDLIMLEAVAAGIPVISDYSGGNAEILSGYKSFINAGERNAKAISDLILRNFYGSKSLPGIGNYYFKFGLNKMAASYGELYKTKMT